MLAAQPIIPPDLREKPRRPVNSDVEAVEKPLFVGIPDEEMARVHRAIFVFGFVDLMRVESAIRRRVGLATDHRLFCRISRYPLTAYP